MARKIIDIVHSASQYDILSQTPKNYDRKNYFIKELQDKVNAEWTYRPNRVDVEYETKKTKDEWEEMEVVVQTVKSDKGNDISNDFKRLVFRNILEDRFRIGHKFRFNPKFFLGAEDEEKDVWLVINRDDTNMTSSVVVERCNGVFGSTYQDSQGVTHFHYEPVIQESDLSSTTFSYGTVSVVPGSRVTVTVQYNKYTAMYKVNQRFIIGARREDPEKEGSYIGGQVYRITAMNNFYSDTTYNSEEVGLMKLYLEVTEASPYDDWDNRIAYQNEQDIRIVTDTSDKNYSIIFKTPETIPANLYSTEILFTPAIMAEDGTEYEENSRFIQTTYSLENWPESKSESLMSNYIDFEQSEYSATGTYTFTLARKKIYSRGDLVITCTLPASVSPTGSDITVTFKMVVRNQEV